MKVPVKCPNCGIKLCEVQAQQTKNADPNWPTKEPESISLMCPDCLENDAIEKGYSQEACVNARKRRQEQIDRMKEEKGRKPKGGKK